MVEGRPQRRVRHITAVQVRNLTPFPARDALASALKQPAQQPQFTPQGHLTDDLDVAIGRKRARRFSSSSSVHVVGTRGEADSACRDGAERTGEPVARRRTLSKASASVTSTNADAPVSPGMARRSSGGIPTVRPSHRQRTISAASVFTSDSGRASSLGWRDVQSSGSRLPELLQDTSQRSLEKVLRSRLIETFITITLPSSKGRNDTDAVGRPLEATTSSRPSTPDLESLHQKSSSVSSKATASSLKSAAARRGSVAGGTTKKPSSRPGTPSRPHTAASPVKPGQSSHRPGTTSASLSNGKTPSSPVSPKTPTTPSIHRQRPSIPSSSPSPSPLKSGFPVTPPATPPLPTSADILSEEPVVPDYISPIHWPSTNPTFQIDARSRGEFALGTNLSGSKLRVEVWGRVKHGLGWASVRNGDVKGKGRALDLGDADGSEWRVLESWDFDLMDLIPLSDDVGVVHPYNNVDSDNTIDSSPLIHRICIPMHSSSHFRLPGKCTTCHPRRPLSNLAPLLRTPLGIVRNRSRMPGKSGVLEKSFYPINCRKQTSSRQFVPFMLEIWMRIRTGGHSGGGARE